jgi:hypothetical protein
MLKQCGIDQYHRCLMGNQLWCTNCLIPCNFTAWYVDPIVLPILSESWKEWILSMSSLFAKRQMSGKGLVGLKSMGPLPFLPNLMFF